MLKNAIHNLCITYKKVTGFSQSRESGAGDWFTGEVRLKNRILSAGATAWG